MGFSISVSPWKKFLATSHFITYKVWYFVTSNGCLKAILDHRSITFHIAISHLFSIYYFPLLQPPSLSSSLIPTAGLASGHHRRGTSAKTERKRYQTFNPDSLFPSLPFPGCHGWHLRFLQDKLLYRINRKIFWSDTSLWAPLGALTTETTGSVFLLS